MSSIFSRSEVNIDSKLQGRPHLRAILYPISVSARYSVSLAENNRVLYSINVKPRLLSPDASSAEDEANENPAKGGTRHVSRTHGGHTQRQDVILLDQSETKEKLTLGSATANDVILKHPDSADENVCYINIVHGQLYPDPDSSSIVLLNSSTSSFIANSCTKPCIERIVANSQHTTLECGRWEVKLGEGLDFELEVLAWTPAQIQGNLELISPISFPVERFPMNEGDVEPLSKWTSGALSVERNITAPRAALVEPERIAGKIVKVQLPTSSTSITIDPLDVRIGQTNFTTVLRRVRNGAVSAIKICRKPTVSNSAKFWRNEMEILSLFNHTSIVKLLNYDIPNLRLELEYGGRDLRQVILNRQRSPISKDVAYQVWVDISSGLEHIHLHKIFHLDIKAGNILVGDDGRAKICDFGHSLQHAVTPIRSAVGTHSYIPPEFLAHSLRGRPGDIWAAGLVMMFVLGIMPRDDPGFWKISDIQWKLNDATRKMRDWLREIRIHKEKIPAQHSLLHRMLEENPTDRITASDLTKILSAQHQTQIGAFLH